MLHAGVNLLVEFFIMMDIAGMVALLPRQVVLSDPYVLASRRSPHFESCK
jgi:hypothetical protein